MTDPDLEAAREELAEENERNRQLASDREKLISEILADGDDPGDYDLPKVELGGKIGGHEGSPAHTWGSSLGTNMADRDRHGTTPRGEGNGFHKITDDQVRQIRALSATGLWQAEVARRVGVHKDSVRWVMSRGGWKHVA